MAVEGECSSHSWEDVDHGGQLMEVCVTCGKCIESHSFENTATWSHDSGLTRSGRPTLADKYYSPRNATRERERRLEMFIREEASKVHLSKESVSICLSEGKSLLNYGVRTLSKRYAAGLVYIELKKTQPTLSFKDFANKVGTKMTVIGKTVKTLQKLLPSVNVSSDHDLEVPFEDRLQLVLDKLTVQLLPKERKNIKKLALDLKELCSDLPIQGHIILCNDSADCAYFTLALLVVGQNNKFNEKKLLHQIHSDTGITLATLRSRLWQIKKILVTLAKRVPSLEHIADDITTRTIQRYIRTLVRNKNILMKDTDRIRILYAYDDAPLSKPSPCLPTSHWLGEVEDDGHLSDLDPEIEEYIASEKEIEKKEELSLKYCGASD